MQLRGPLPFMLGDSNRYLPTQTGLSVVLQHDNNQRRLQTVVEGCEPILKISNIHLEVERYVTRDSIVCVMNVLGFRVTVAPSILLNIEQNLRNGSRALYYGKRFSYYSQQLPTGTSVFNETIFQGGTHITKGCLA